LKHFALPVEVALVRLDGHYGDAAVIAQLMRAGGYLGVHVIFLHGGRQRREKAVEWAKACALVARTHHTGAKTAKMGEGLIFLEGKESKKEKAEKLCQTRTTSKSSVRKSSEK
jgi:hypothetical protein